MSRPLIIASLAALLVASCGSEPEDTRPGQPVAHRRAAFKEMIKSFEEMGAMLRKDKFSAGKFTSLTASLVAMRDKPWQYFGPDTQYPPSKATDAVWSQAAEFENRKQEFLSAMERLNAASGTQDAKLAKAAFDDVEKTCRNCHDTFKTR